jgi:5-methylcytosine-specific restriction enzyme subunit McrC
MAQSRGYLDVASRVKLKPDITWHVGGKVAAVADAKYKAEKPSGYPNPTPTSTSSSPTAPCWACG